MTAISAWWRSNMPFQRLSGRLNYYITQWDWKSVSWRSDELETRCGRESHHPTEGALGTPSEFWRPVGQKMLEWEHVPERLGPQAPGWADKENENDTRRSPEGLGRSICCSLCSVSNSLSHTQPFQIKWEVYFFKEVFARLYSLRQYVSCMYMCIYAYLLWWLYNSHSKVKDSSLHYYLPIAGESRALWNANSLVQVLNSCRRVHFLRLYPLHYDRLLRRADECKSLLICLHWCVHAWGSTEECHLWVRPNFFNFCIFHLSYLNGLWDGRYVATQLLFCWDVAYRIGSKQHVAFLFLCRFFSTPFLVCM